MYKPTTEDLALMIEIMETGHDELFVALSDDAQGWLLDLMRNVVINKITMAQAKILYLSGL